MIEFAFTSRSLFLRLQFGPEAMILILIFVRILQRLL